MAKVAPPAFQVGNNASQWLIFVGSTTTTPLGQVKTFNWVQDLTEEETKRVSDSATYYTGTAVKVSGPLELWQGNTNAEQTSVGGVTLTPDDPEKTIIAVLYTAEATSGTSIATYTFTGFKITQITAGPREGQSQTYSAYNWRATLMSVV